MTELLIQHGRAGHLGRFRADGLLPRGRAVVVDSQRGREWGEVLRPLREGSFPDPFLGAVVREATSDDEAARGQADALAVDLLLAAAPIARALGVPVEAIDAEVLLDGRVALLHAVAVGPADAGPLLDALGERFGLIVRLHDLLDAPPAPADAPDHDEPITCGKPDCGSGDCSSCGSGGGCNSCSSGQAQELVAHFAHLRDDMDKRHSLL